MLNPLFQRSKLVKKSDMIDVQRLYELSEEFKTQMNVELESVTSHNDTLDKLNSKIVESIMSFMESKFKSIHLKKSKLSK